MATDPIERGTRETLPYWVEQKPGYAGSVFLHGVYLGFTKGQWPVQAFAGDPDGGCSMGARWAAQAKVGAGEERVIVGPILILDDVPVLSVVTTPVQYGLEPRETP